MDPASSRQLNVQHANLAEHGIVSKQAADLRWRSHTFSEGWEMPEMDVYDSQLHTPQSLND